MSSAGVPPAGRTPSRRPMTMTEYVLDDGGMNLLSSSALRALQAVILSRELRGAQRMDANDVPSPGVEPALSVVEGRHPLPATRGEGHSEVLGESPSPRLRGEGARRADEGPVILNAAKGFPPNFDGHRLFLLRSARPKVFAAGADMAEMQRFSPREASEFARLGQETFAAIERLPCLTVALVDGDCFGGALDLVLAFDFRFATPRARFAHPGARLGIVTGFGGTSRWRRVISRPAAHQLFLANRVLSANEALQMNLVDRVAETHDDELQRLAAIDPRRARFVKELALHADNLSRSELILVAERLRGIYFT